MNSVEIKLSPFLVKDCALVQMAHGVKAYTLTEIKDKLLNVPDNSIYYHFWGGRLRTAFEHSEYHNDFSRWSHESIHDDILAERFEILNPNEYASMNDLSKDIIEIIEERIDEGSPKPWLKGDHPFYFCNSRIVIFSTPFTLKEPKDLLQVIPLLPKSSLFYHFIDASRRTPDKKNDFTVWLKEAGAEYIPLVEQIDAIDQYLISLQDLQKKLVNIITQFFCK
jgi:hypothetical protein